MRYKQYLEQDNYPLLQTLIEMSYYADDIDNLDELARSIRKGKVLLKKDYRKGKRRLKSKHETLFQKAQAVGQKLGLKVEKSESLWTLLARVGEKSAKLMKYVLEYLNTDVTDNVARKKVITKAKSHITKMEKREIANFILMIDANTTHLTIVIRHTIQALFGIEIGTYSKWLDDAKWFEEELEKMEKVLKRMGDNDTELKALKQFKTTLDKTVLANI